MRDKCCDLRGLRDGISAGTIVVSLSSITARACISALHSEAHLASNVCIAYSSRNLPWSIPLEIRRAQITFFLLVS